MFRLGERQISIVICCAIFLHLFWAAMIVLNEAALNATAVNVLYRTTQSSSILILILVTSSIMAAWALVSRRSWGPLLLIPQQIILMASASASIEAIWLGQFADGVSRSWEFIAADQIWPIIISIAHTFAIIIHAMQAGR